MYSSFWSDLIKVLLGLGAFITSIVFMIRVKSKIVSGQISQEALTKKEKTIIWVLCLLNPLIAGAVFYYGWKKLLPKKAKQANTISFAAFGIVLVLVIILSLK